MYQLVKTQSLQLVRSLRSAAAQASENTLFSDNPVAAAFDKLADQLHEKVQQLDEIIQVRQSQESDSASLQQTDKTFRLLLQVIEGEWIRPLGNIQMHQLNQQADSSANDNEKLVLDERYVDYAQSHADLVSRLQEYHRKQLQRGVTTVIDDMQ